MELTAGGRPGPPGGKLYVSCAGLLCQTFNNGYTRPRVFVITGIIWEEENGMDVWMFIKEEII